MIPAATIDSEPAARRRSPSFAWLLGATAALVGFLSAIRIVAFWSNQAYLHVPAGVWTALAYDFANGTFYRALDGPLGYGGTRYFPLFFTLHGGLIRLTGDAIWAGYFLSLVSIVFLMGGVFVLLRRLGVRPEVAGPATVVMLASQIVQDVLLTVRGDALATAFGIWGAAICLPFWPGASALYAAAVLFTLSFATKATCIGPFLAVVAGLALTRRWRAALQLFLATSIGFVVVLVLMHLASDGRAFEALRAAGGTTTLRDVLLSPFTLARLARQEPETLVFIALGCAAFLRATIKSWGLPQIPGLLFLATAAASAAVFSFEGTDTNHLLDLFVMAVVMIAVVAADEDRGSRVPGFATSALVVAALAASMSLVSGLINRDTEQRWGTTAEALAFVDDPSRPILAENPVLSVARGEQPYVLDPFMLRLFRDRNPLFGEPVWAKLRNRQFAAVILDRDPHTERGRDWYLAFFGKGFVEEMDRNYVEKGRVKARLIYVPRLP